ncbi:nuclear transport factor 2 family protein [Chromobacterium sphagni]|uniref:Isomerase n=1 Tax=Chromobacterium sphagni TaxID=1903179 RepID=A0ABX3CG83_9NEIS|nr:nuclear transport factor 2 family protein [Chromobacterium sphagni]OHX21340.1 isomerase [Chromobacterium sphagni]
MKPDDDFPALSALLDWYQALSPDNLGDIDRYSAPDARLKDPFNDVAGVRAIEAVFRHMFHRLAAPRFVVAALRQRNQAFVSRDFHFGLGGRQYRIHGGSHLFFDDSGLVDRHRDYWDAAEELLQKLPLIGAPIAWLRRRLAAD